LNSPRATCPRCFKRVRLRKNGILGLHRVKIYEASWARGLQVLLAELPCPGAGLTPGDARDSQAPWPCGWCESPGPCSCPGR
jgi:hypothetical protein